MRRRHATCVAAPTHDAETVENTINTPLKTRQTRKQDTNQREGDRRRDKIKGERLKIKGEEEKIKGEQERARTHEQERGAIGEKIIPG